MPFATKAIRDRARRRVAQRVKAGEPCVFCKRPIDLSIPYPDPQSFVVDHGIPTSLGGTDAYEHLRPAHNTCNSKRSNLPTGSVGRNSGALQPHGGVGKGGLGQRSPDLLGHRDQSGTPN